MSHTPLSPQNYIRAEALAREAADRYFAALALEIPYDTAPGEVDLITAGAGLSVFRRAVAGGV